MIQVNITGYYEWVQNSYYFLNEVAHQILWNGWNLLYLTQLLSILAIMFALIWFAGWCLLYNNNNGVFELPYRHGRIQSVKLLEEVNSNNGGRPGKSATIAFIDIRSASKALRNVRTVAGELILI